jgi:hypothetical protein
LKLISDSTQKVAKVHGAHLKPYYTPPPSPNQITLSSQELVGLVSLKLLKIDLYSKSQYVLFTAQHFFTFINDYSAEVTYYIWAEIIKIIVQKQNDLAVDVRDSIPSLPSPITSAKMKASEIRNVLQQIKHFCKT